MHLDIQASSDGHLIASDERSLRTVSKALSAGEIQQLDKLLSQTRLPAVPPPPSTCADCFIYDLEIASIASVRHIHVDDTNLGASGAIELIEFLRQLRDEALHSAY